MALVTEGHVSEAILPDCDLRGGVYSVFTGDGTCGELILSDSSDGPS